MLGDRSLAQEIILTHVTLFTNSSIIDQKLNAPVSITGSGKKVINLAANLVPVWSAKIHKIILLTESINMEQFLLMYLDEHKYNN